MITYFWKKWCWWFWFTRGSVIKPIFTTGPLFRKESMRRACASFIIMSASSQGQRINRQPSELKGNFWLINFYLSKPICLSRIAVNSITGLEKFQNMHTENYSRRTFGLPKVIQCFIGQIPIHLEFLVINSEYNYMQIWCNFSRVFCDGSLFDFGENLFHSLSLIEKSHTSQFYIWSDISRMISSRWLFEMNFLFEKFTSLNCSQFSRTILGRVKNFEEFPKNLNSHNMWSC